MANLQMPAIRKHEKEMRQPWLKNNQCNNLFLKNQNTVVLKKIVTPLIFISTTKQDAESFPQTLFLVVFCD